MRVFITICIFSRVVFQLFVSICAVDYLERLVSKTADYLLCGVQCILTQSCNEDVFMLQDMFTVESKHSQSEPSISFNSPDDLCLGDVITSDGSGAVFAAEIRQRHPGIMFTASLTHSSSTYEQLCLSV